MASIDKRGRKYLVRWRDPDGQQRARSAPDHATAKELARDVERTIALGERWEPRDAHAEAAPPTLREVAAAWLERSQRVGLAPRTLIRYAQFLESFVVWLEGLHKPGCSPKVLSQAGLDRYWTALTREPLGRWKQPRSETTARKHLEVIHMFWAWAAARDEWAAHVPPARKVDLPNAAPPVATLAPSWAHMDQVILSAGGWQRPLAIVLRCTGLRVQQALGLRWADIDLEADRLVIRGELGKMRSEKVGRTIPIAPPLADELRHSRLWAWDRSAEWIVPCARIHRRPRERDFDRAWQRAGVPPELWEGHPHHALRRGFITGLRGLGGDRDAVEYLVGHKLPGMDPHYVDVWKALPLVKTVALVPQLPDARG